MSSIYWKKHTLQFKQPSGTSRGVLLNKDSWFLIKENPEWQYPAIGECSLISGLSPESLDTYEPMLDRCCNWLNGAGEKPDLTEYPSIAFGLEMLENDIESKGSKLLFPSDFTMGKNCLLTNGLIWMGDTAFMKAQVVEKIKAGFQCIKLKVGARDFASELALLKWIRTEFKIENPALRVDANGAFEPKEALEKLKRLSDHDLHSIEQPIRAGQMDKMTQLCAQTPIPIALDEELIGVCIADSIEMLLRSISPQYIILKPSLLGGWTVSNVYMGMAEKLGIGWWLTSALESNIGLNAIAQYTYTKNVTLPQGLGTGGLYVNNFKSPLYLEGQFLKTRTESAWNLNPLLK